MTVHHPKAKGQFFWNVFCTTACLTAGYLWFIVQLQQEVQEQQNEISRETRLKEKLDKEVKKLHMDMEAKTGDIRALNMQVQRATEEQQRLEQQIKELKVNTDNRENMFKNKWLSNMPDYEEIIIFIFNLTTVSFLRYNWNDTLIVQYNRSLVAVIKTWFLLNQRLWEFYNGWLSVNQVKPQWSDIYEHLFTTHPHRLSSVIVTNIELKRMNIICNDFNLHIIRWSFCNTDIIINPSVVSIQSQIIRE